MRNFSRRADFYVKMGLRLFAALLILTAMYGCSMKESGAMPRAIDGVMDLSDWDWDRDGMVPLSGEWRFEWKGSPGQGKRQAAPDTMQVPGMWDEARTKDGNPVPDQGYGVYRLKVLHRLSEELLAVRLPNVSTAYRLYVDGKPVLERGRADIDASNTVPFQMPATVYLSGAGTVTELTMEVANFHHRRGGIRAELIMGRASQIDNLQAKQAAQEYIVFGCLLMIGLYHIGLFALRRREIANLFFALLCLFVALRMGLIGEVFMARWFPQFTWETSVRFEYTAFVLSGWSGFAYYQRLYPGEIRRAWVNGAAAAALVLCAAAAVLPTLWFTSWLIVYQVDLLTVCIIIIAGLILSAYRNKEGARLALTGAAGMVATVVNDMLFYNGWWRSVDLVPFGLLFLIFTNSIIIALRSSKTFERAEQLSSELKQWNDKLEERIAERTEELRKSYETLEEANTGLERMELSRRQLVSNISHDLRTPITLLQGYLEALRDGVISSEEQRDSTIRLMLGKVEGLNGLIQDLFELSVLEAGKAELTRSGITLGEWLNHLDEQYRLDLREKGIRFSCSLGSEADETVKAEIDIRRMDRVFANLLFNAVRYTPPDGMIRLTIKRLPDTRKIEITVEDSGTGIHPDDLPHIFDRFYKKDKSRHSSSGGSGLGLAISREIVELHGGTIGAYNRPEGGSAFRIVLPAESTVKASAV